MTEVSEERRGVWVSLLWVGLWLSPRGNFLFAMLDSKE